MRRAATAALGPILVVGLGACSSSSAASCTPVERIVEPGGSSIHVIDGDDVTFELSPPTSGPHQLPAPPGGVADDPIAEARQVSALEQGSVILQYTSDLSADDIATLATLASDDVVVAPAARPLDDGAVVAFSAWSHRQLCSALDIDAATTFVDDRVGAYFVDHGAG